LLLKPTYTYTPRTLASMLDKNGLEDYEEKLEAMVEPTLTMVLGVVWL